MTCPDPLLSAVGAQVHAASMSAQTRDELMATYRVMSDGLLAEWQELDAGLYRRARAAADRCREVQPVPP